LADAVHHAHGRGVIHRDLKPANVLMTADETPKVTDFGLAKLVGDEARQTQSEVVLGTPAYMAPEQAAGKSREVGPAADVWALGPLRCALLPGRVPFQPETVQETLLQVLAADPVPPHQLRPGLPRDPDTICLKCLEKDPPRRYASAQELADDLRRFLNHQ